MCGRLVCGLREIPKYHFERSAFGMPLFSVDLRKFEDAFRAIVARHYFRKWLPLSVIIGVAAGISAIAFYEMLRHATIALLVEIAGYHPPAPAGEGETFFKFPEKPYLIPLVTCVGGLISGLLVYLFAPEAEGHGTDAAIDSFHNKQGEIRMRVPLIKMVASAITIGSGGSAGREGPIALTSAGVASIVGKLFKLTGKDRRIAVAVGIGSGIGAIFRAPFGGAILAAEILYLRDFEIEALVPSFIASVIAYSIFSMVYGWQPIFEGGEQYFFKDPLSLIYYAFLGVLCGLIGILYIKSFYGVKSLFDRWRIPNVFKPAVGGLLLGIIGIWIPHVLGTSYGWLQKVILGDFSAVSASLIIAIIFLKIVATALTVGSGGSGGVFAPALVIGGMTGAATWLLFHSLGMMPEASPAPYVIVGMMAFFGGVGKVPIAVILMVSEMTGTYSLIVPSMLSTTIAYVLTGENTIYISQVPTRANSPAHMTEYSVPLLMRVKVKDAMTRSLITVKPSDLIMKAAELMAKHEIRGLPVVKNNHLIGMITFSDILRVPPEQREMLQVKDVMSRNVLVAYPDESLFEAFEKMIHYQVGRLPVVESPKSGKLVGIITRGDIGRVYELRMSEIMPRERS